MPVVSVVIPSYNSARYLPETLNSLISQTFDDIEVIVVDDGSTDNTEEVVAGAKSSKIRYVKQRNSGGPSRPRNVGIDLARGKYIALCDSDDIMLPDKLANAVSFLEHQPQLGLLFANFVLCDEKGNPFPGTFLDTYDGFWKLPRRKTGERQFVIESRAAYEGLVFENYIGTTGVVIPKSVLSSVGEFDESLAGPEDWDMWFRISRSYDIGYLDVIGHRYRQRETGITGRGAKAMGPHQLTVMRRQLERGLSPAVSTQAQWFVAQVLFGLGYYYQCRGDLKQARHHYWLSLKESFSWSALRGIFISYLGPRLVTFLRDFKSKAKLQADRTPNTDHGN